MNSRTCALRAQSSRHPSGRFTDPSGFLDFPHWRHGHTLVLPFSMPGKAAVSALLNSPLGLWVSLKIKDFKYILHDLVSKINIKFKKIYIYRKERKIFVHFIVSKTYSKLLRLHMPRFLLKKAKPGYVYTPIIGVQLFYTHPFWVLYAIKSIVL